MNKIRKVRFVGDKWLPTERNQFEFRILNADEIVVDDPEKAMKLELENLKKEKAEMERRWLDEYKKAQDAQQKLQHYEKDM